jgi:hypothetical protein
MLDYYKHERISGGTARRWWFVVMFIISTLAFATLFTGRVDFNVIHIVNLFFSFFWGWASWPTLTGTTATSTGKEVE